MYKIAVLGDYDSIYGFATLGLDTFPVSTREEAGEKDVYKRQVISTTTHFIMKKYKEHGTLMRTKNKTERMPVTP